MNLPLKSESTTSPCQCPRGFLDTLFGRAPKTRHVCKVTKRENLGFFFVYSESSLDGLETRYRVAEHVTCLRCGATTVREVNDILPATEVQP